MRPGLLEGEWERGGLCTGPSPLGDSPAVILCLDEPFTSPLSSSSPPSPCSGHSPPPSVAPSTILSSLGGTQPMRQKPLPQARGPKESRAPLEKPHPPLSYARPLSRQSPPCGRPLVCQSEKGGTLKTMTHTGEVPRQLPDAPNGHQQGFKLLGLRHVLFWFVLILLLYVNFALV